jgi:FkbM family methyltransferase
MNSPHRALKGPVQRVLFSPLLAPLLGQLNRAAHRWLGLTSNRDNDPVCNGEHWLVDACQGLRIFVDVGFNEGEWARHVIARNPEASVHAFDPDPGVASRAARLRDTRLRFYPVALSKRDGTASFVSFGDCNPSNSLNRPHHNHGPNARGKTSEVPTSTLDTWAKDNGIHSVDVLKIDAEGYDFDVLQGASELFAERRVGVCVFEYGYCWLETGSLLAEASAFLSARGYELFRLFPCFLAPYRWNSSHDNYLSGQFVAVRPDLVARFDRRSVDLGF